MEKHSTKQGFTIVELLTVMSVIAILIGLLVPALNLVRRMAKDTNQKAQFHSINVALEIYNGEQEAYPDSTVKGSTDYTVGAQHLAEALVGRDLLGYDPTSTWDAEADEGEATIYSSLDPPKSSNQDEVDASLDRRKGPYLNPENVEAYQIQQLYDDTSIGGSNIYDGNNAPVLTDAYRVKSIALRGRLVKIGSPILYYKANISSREFPEIGDTISTPADYIFNIMDNEDLLFLGTMKDQNMEHYANSSGDYDERLFYDEITNQKITSMARPYNQTSYILISAGYDGIFGTNDDIFNFNE